MIDRDTLRRQINSAQYRDRAIDEITDIAMRHIAAARAEALEEAARVCELQSGAFLSTEYATGQPLSSFSERFACNLCAGGIRALAQSAAPEGEKP
jgi:hypothetical protein